MIDEILGDRYLIQQQLGKKSGRRTLLARDLQTQELVVLKLLLFTSNFEWDDLKLFEREAKILQTLSHPAIPRYLNYFELAETYGKGFALVQTYIEAQSLEAQLKAGRTFTEVEVKQLATALLDILVYLHGQRPPVIHRDIKPSNILLTNRSGNSVGQVYLVDFGSVQTLAAKEGGTITVVGTYGYMPQEQFGGRTVPASDLYGLGATLIYVVTGVHPAELPQQDFRLQFESLTTLSPELTEWLQWMTEPRLEKRLTSASNALSALKNEIRHRSRSALKQIKTHTLSDLEKPYGSKISVTRSQESLKITVPTPVELMDILPATIVSALAIQGLLVAWFTGLLMMQGTWMLPLFALMSLTITKIYIACIRPIWTQIHLDRQRILLFRESRFFKYRFHSAQTQTITKVEYTQKHLRTYSTVSVSKSFQAPAQLNIWAEWNEGEPTMSLTLENLTDWEKEWLAKEISRWLNIPNA